MEEVWPLTVAVGCFAVVLALLWLKMMMLERRHDAMVLRLIQFANEIQSIAKVLTAKLESAIDAEVKDGETGTEK